MTDYNVNFTDPAVPAVSIKPRTVNGPGSPVADTTLRLFGDGHTNWGEAVNENFVRLLENFMGATAPVNPITGQMWVDVQLYFHDTVGLAFYEYDVNPASGTYHTWVSFVPDWSQASPPTVTSLDIGKYWYDTSTTTLYWYQVSNDGVAATWMARSMETGTAAPTSTPVYQVNVYDASTATWKNVAGATVSDSTSAPSGSQVGSLRYSIAAGTLYVWTGVAWDALISSSNPVFTGNINANGNRVINVADAVDPTDALNMQTGDARYVNVTGDTMTGDLVLNADPSVALGAATKQYVETWAAPAVHTHLLASITDAGTAAAVDTGILPANIPLVSDINGKHTIWVPAAAITARSTTGAGTTTVETTTNKITFKTLAFDTATEEYAQFFVQMPKSWNESTVTARMVWSHSTGAVSYGVTWGVSAVAFSSGDALDVALGTEQTVNTVGGTANVLYRSSETTPITIAGAPVAEDVVAFQIARKVADAGDTLGIDARLHGVVIYYNTDALNDA